MNQALSSASKHLGKSIVLGTLFPVIIFSTFWFIDIEPVYPIMGTLLKPFNLQSEQWAVVATSLLAIVIAVILYNFNIHIIRWYEGYFWRESYLGQWFIKSNKNRYRKLKARQAGMRTLLRVLNKKSETFKKINGEWNRVNRQLASEFPVSYNSILPTRLGNAIRGFETYPRDQYGIAAITLWSRIIAQIDEDHAKVIEDSKTSFDFMINSSFLFGILAIFSLVTVLLNLNSPAQISNLTVHSFLKLFALSILCFLFYRWSIARAIAWGNLVKSAFDLYRWDLLKKMGYSTKPRTKTQERNIWRNISLQMVYGDKPSGPRIDYAPPSSIYVEKSPPNVNLEITRGVKRGLFDDEFEIFISVKNTTKELTAENVVVKDKLPENAVYKWGSFIKGSQTDRMEGINPYRFYIGDIGPQAEAVFSYTAIINNNFEK